MACKHSWLHLGYDEWQCENCGTLDSLGDPDDMTEQERKDLGYDR